MPAVSTRKSTKRHRPGFRRGIFPALEEAVAYMNDKTCYGDLSFDEKLADPSIRLYVALEIQKGQQVGIDAFRKRHATLNDDKAMFWLWFSTSREKVLRKHKLTDKGFKYLTLMYLVGSGRIVAGMAGVTKFIIADMMGDRFDNPCMRKLVNRGFAEVLLIGPRSDTWYAITGEGRKVINNLMAIFAHQYKYAEDVLLKHEREYRERVDAIVEHKIAERHKRADRFVKKRAAGHYDNLPPEKRKPRKAKPKDHFPGAKEPDELEDNTSFGEII